MCQEYIASNIERSSFTAVVGIKISSSNPEIYCCKRSTHKFSSFLLTILTKKNCGWLAASGLFDIFTQSIKFYNHGKNIMDKL